MQYQVADIIMIAVKCIARMCGGEGRYVNGRGEHPAATGKGRYVIYSTSRLAEARSEYEGGARCDAGQRRDGTDFT